MKFTEWWESKGRQEFAARIKDCGPTYHDCQPETVSIDDAEFIAKHVAWDAWTQGMLQGGEIMAAGCAGKPVA